MEDAQSKVNLDNADWNELEVKEKEERKRRIETSEDQNKGKIRVEKGRASQ